MLYAVIDKDQSVKETSIILWHTLFFKSNKKQPFLKNLFVLDLQIALSYNNIMKKILLLLIIAILSVDCANAQPFKFDNVKNIFNKNIQAKQQNAKQTTSNGDMTPSEQATLFYNENNLKSSLDTLLAIKEEDRTAQDWVLLGNILQDQNKTSDAVFMYQRAIMVNPKFYKPYYNLGNIYLDEEKPYLAIENYKKANKTNSEFAYAYYNLGCAYLRIGNLKKAKITFLKAIEIKNTEPNFHYNLAYTYKMLNKQKLAKQYLDNYNKLMANKMQD